MFNYILVCNQFNLAMYRVIQEKVKAKRVENQNASLGDPKRVGSTN